MAPPYSPPDDLGVLADAGSSFANALGRQIPRDSAVTYHFPLLDIPAAPATLRVVLRAGGFLNPGDKILPVTDRGSALAGAVSTAQ